MFVIWADSLILERSGSSQLALSLVRDLRFHSVKLGGCLIHERTNLLLLLLQSDHQHLERALALSFFLLPLLVLVSPLSVIFLLLVLHHLHISLGLLDLLLNVLDVVLKLSE